MNHDVRDSVNLVYNPLCPSVCYLPEIRSSVSQYLVQSHCRQSLYSYRNAWSRDQSLCHIELIMMMHYRVAPRYLSVIRSDKSQSRFVPTQQTLSEIPIVHLYSHQLHCDVWYTQSIPTVSGSCTISWSKEMILDIRKALAKWTTQSCAMLMNGSCPSHYSPNEVIPFIKWQHMSMVRKLNHLWLTS